MIQIPQLLCALFRHRWSPVTWVTEFSPWDYQYCRRCKLHRSRPGRLWLCSSETCTRSVGPWTYFRVPEGETR